MQSEYAWLTVLLMTVIVVSAVLDRHRSIRREADRAAGRSQMMPWAWILVTALIAATFCARMWLMDV